MNKRTQKQYSSPVSHLMDRYNVTGYGLWKLGYIKNQGAFSRKARASFDKLHLGFVKMLADALHLSLGTTVEELYRLSKLYPTTTNKKNNANKK